MKAKEYYAKYKDQIMSKNGMNRTTALCDLLCELSNEAKEMIAKRNIKTDDGTVAVLHEMNEKFNAVCRLFEKEFGLTPLRKDGFMNYWRNKIPALDERLSRKEDGHNVAGSV